MSLAADGNFYGTTMFGGTVNAGIVFKITPSGKPTLFYANFGTDGSFPLEVIQATDGNFYGTTSSVAIDNAGTVFKITPGGRLD